MLQHTRAVTSLQKEIAKNEERIEKNNTLMLEMRETYNDITEEIEELENKVVNNFVLQTIIVIFRFKTV